MRHNQQQHLAALHHSLKISPSQWGISEHFVLQIKKPRYRAINCPSWNLMHWVSDPNQEFAHPKILSGWWRKMDISGVWGFFPVEGHGYLTPVCSSRELHMGPGGTWECQPWWQLMIYLCPVHSTRDMVLAWPRAAPSCTFVMQSLSHYTCSLSAPTSLWWKKILTI